MRNPIIDHDPNERPRRKPFGWIWWPAWAMLALLWYGQWYFDGVHWGEIGLGFMSGAFLALWCVDMTISAGRGRDL
jgi:hypothetical protein